MFIVIRVDSSIQIGSGHVMRCMALANELKKKGADILFICRDTAGNMANVLENNRFQVTLLPTQEKDNSNISDPEDILDSWGEDVDETIQTIENKTVDWCIVDHYGLDERWHRKISKHVRNIFVIDDITNRKLYCDILLDQTFGRKNADYQANVPDTCMLLLGSKYALLRPEFKSLRDAAREKRKNINAVKRILIAMGGTDVKNVTSLALKAVENYGWREKPVVDVVLSSSAPNINKIKLQAKNANIVVNVHLDASNMADLMLNADLAIGAGGSTSWERCCLGLPTITIITANNQSEIVNNLDKAGAIVNLGRSDDINIENVEKTLNELISKRSRSIEMSVKSFDICNGEGAELCANKIYSNAT